MWLLLVCSRYTLIFLTFEDTTSSLKNERMILFQKLYRKCLQVLQYCKDDKHVSCPLHAMTCLLWRGEKVSKVWTSPWRVATINAIKVRLSECLCMYSLFNFYCYFLLSKHYEFKTGLFLFSILTPLCYQNHGFS